MESGPDVLRIGDTTELALALDELEEKRDMTAIQMVEYHHRAARQRDKLVIPKAFKRGDLVLRLTFDEGKLNPKWEGPFTIIDDGLKGAYRLQSPCEKIESRPWNSAYLKKYIQ